MFCVNGDNNTNNDSNSNNTSNNNNSNNGGGHSAEAVLDETDYSGYGDAKSGIYTKTITYYQFRKAVTTTKTIYTCPSGYNRSGTKCIKTSTGATIDATPIYGPDRVVTTDAKKSDGSDHTVYVKPEKKKIRTDYSCPSGYTLNGSKCIKYTDATEKPGQSTYTCPTGYTLSGTKCTKTYDATYTPGGSVSQPTFSGSSMTSTGDFTPAGSVTLTKTNKTATVNDGKYE